MDATTEPLVEALGADFRDDELDAILAWGNETACPGGTSALPTSAGPASALPTSAGPASALPASDTASAAPASALAVRRCEPAVYDPAVEEREYSRALMAPGDLARLKADVSQFGYMTIDQVRELVKQNTAKETQEARGETYAVDPEIMMQIDMWTNYHTFIAGDNVYTRAELLAHYPFEDFRTDPESVFVQQEIGVFPPRKWADKGEGAHEYVARDIGDGEDFIMVEDLVGRAARRDYVTKRAPVRIVKTKVFLGKDKWDDFKLMKRFAHSFATFVAPLMLEGGESPAKVFGALLCAGGGFARPALDRE